MGLSQKLWENEIELAGDVLLGRYAGGVAERSVGEDWGDGEGLADEEDSGCLCRSL